jgi:hypothetical protein
MNAIASGRPIGAQARRDHDELPGRNPGSPQSQGGEPVTMRARTGIEAITGDWLGGLVRRNAYREWRWRIIPFLAVALMSKL